MHASFDAPTDPSCIAPTLADFLLEKSIADLRTTELWTYSIEGFITLRFEYPFLSYLRSCKGWPDVWPDLVIVHLRRGWINRWRSTRVYVLQLGTESNKRRTEVDGGCWLQGGRAFTFLSASCTCITTIVPMQKVMADLRNIA